MAQTAEYLRRWRALNPEKLAGYKALRTQSGRKSESDKKAYLKNRAKKLAYRKEYYAKNKEKAIADSKAWYAENKAVALAKQKVRYSKIRDTPEQRLREYQSSAKARGVVFSLTMEQFVSFWQQPCFYGGESIKTIGLDRVDSNLGYVVGNVVPCCRGCNIAKLDGTSQEFIARCHRVARIHSEDSHGV